MRRHPFEQRLPRRFWPSRGVPLTLDNIRGPWRPSGAVCGACVFAVVWSTRSGDWWAPLHDFCPETQLRLVESCRWQDRAAGFEGAWPEGRFA
jgi:hypothetical protein